MRWGSSALVPLALLALGCSDGPTSADRRDFAAVEAAIEGLSAAEGEDQGARLAELEALAVESPRAGAVRDLCVKAYRSFGEANGKLAIARGKTRDVESAVALARTMGPRDAGLPSGEAERLRGLQTDAVGALDGATRSLDQAESLVKACRERRADLRTFLGR